VPGAEVDYMDVAARQMVSVATAMIPFLEHDDATARSWARTCSGRPFRWCWPRRRSSGTGMEYRAAVDAGDVVVAEKPGVVTEVSADAVTSMNDDGTYTTYRIAKFRRSNQGTSYNQRVPRRRGCAGSRWVRPSPTVPRRTRARWRSGKNLLVAFMSWEGHNYEDAIILSQRLVQDDVLSSIHIEEHEVDARDTKLGPEEITRDIPNVAEEVLADLDERGIIRIGAEVVPGDILVGKVTPKGETELTPEERLLRAIFGEKAREVRDTSLKVPHGESGTVIGVKLFDREEGDELPPGVNQLVRVYVAQKRKITDGDKLAGRHGNKGVISKILPVEDMPFLEDGTAGRRRPQPARRAEPDERRPGARDPPRLGGLARLGGRGQPGVGQGLSDGREVGGPGHPGRVAGLRRRRGGGDHRSPRLEQQDARRRPADRRLGQGQAVRRPHRRAVPGPDLGRLHVHPEAAPPGGRQDPRPLDRPLLDDHAAAAGR
jgi:DNA-directed RNA polymerase subunit beta